MESRPDFIYCHHLFVFLYQLHHFQNGVLNCTTSENKKADMYRMAGEVRLELTTYGLTDRRYYRLSYSPIIIVNGLYHILLQSVLPGRWGTIFLLPYCLHAYRTWNGMSISRTYAIGLYKVATSKVNSKLTPYKRLHKLWAYNPLTKAKNNNNKWCTYILVEET